MQALIRQPISHRRPVGYREQFLDEYVPGKTWYLPESTRAQLYEQGRTPDDSRPAGTYARDIYERLLIDLAWASSKLEGNTYSKLDTQNLLENGIRAEGKDASEAIMLLNHKNAIALLVEQAEDISFNRYTLFNLHAALSENLLGNKKDEGRLREIVVGVTGTTFVPLSIPQKITVIREMVINLEPPIRSAIERVAKQHEIPAEYFDAFTELAYALLVDLHEGAIHRHGIRPSEFRSWKAKISANRTYLTSE